MANKHSVPTHPRAVFCGRLMSPEFSNGVYALRHVLEDVEQQIGDDARYRNDEHQSAALLANRITQLLDGSCPESRAGAIAAMAHWIAINMMGSCPSADDWLPLESTYDGDTDSVHPLATFFDVAGEPVSINPDLVALQWIADPIRHHRCISVDVVRLLGKPISRKRFDAMRDALVAD